MSALSIQPTYPIFTDIDGQPLEDGYVWIGVANLAPIGNPITVYWNAALTIPAAQPIRTRGGYPVNSGTPARLYVNSDYSIQVQNKNGSTVYSAPTATERYSSELITFTQSGSGAVQRTVQSKLQEIVSVKDFGAVGNGLSDDTLAIQNAVNGANTVLFPNGTYLFSADYTFPENVKLIFDGGAVLDHGNNNIYFQGPVITVDSSIVSGAGIASFASAAQVIKGNILIRPGNKPTTDQREQLYRNTPFVIAEDHTLPKSLTSVTPGLGNRTFILDEWIPQFGLIGLQVYVYDNNGSPVIDGATPRMGGSLIAFNEITRSVTINMTTNNLPAVANANWKMIIDRPIALFIDDTNQDNKSTSCGIIGWVGASKANPTPFSYVLALYAGNTAIPCIYGQTNGRWGFGTEAPVNTLHAVGQTIDGTTLPGGVRADYLLTNPRPLVLEHINNVALGGQTAWLYAGATPEELDTLKYPSFSGPLQKTQRSIKEYDLYKIVNSGNTYVDLMTITLPASGFGGSAFTVECIGGGGFIGQFGGGVDAVFDVYLDATYLPIVTPRGSKTNWGFGAGFGAVNQCDIRVVQTAFLIKIQAKSGLDPVNPIAWYMYSAIRIVGFLGYSNVTITIN